MHRTQGGPIGLKSTTIAPVGRCRRPPAGDARRPSMSPVQAGARGIPLGERKHPS